MQTICHITSVHNRYDPRILKKECVSLAKLSYNVVLIVSNGLPDENYKGVKIIDTGKFKNRFNRFIKSNFYMYRAILKVKPVSVHFHDPELIPLGLFLRSLGYKVIYDIHEDYVTDIREKYYLNSLLKIIFSYFIRFAEFLSHRFLHTIIAERYYSKRFANSTYILNYPNVSEIKISSVERTFQFKKLLYTGTLTEIRGGELIANLLNYDDEMSITCIGSCSSKLAKKMYDVAGINRDRLTLIGVDEYIPFDKIIELYQKDDWLAGIAFFNSSINHDKKELTKFFEYMAAGLPILATNFKVWKELIEENKVGYCFDTGNIPDIIKKINEMYSNKNECIRMSKLGIQLVNERYNWKSEEKKLADLYSNLF
ncbi:MAG: glycosyltransferase [Saonia sp.]